jgi:hypothetical protein
MSTGNFDGKGKSSFSFALTGGQAGKIGLFGGFMVHCQKAMSRGKEEKTCERIF